MAPPNPGGALAGAAVYNASIGWPAYLAPPTNALTIVSRVNRPLSSSMAVDSFCIVASMIPGGMLLVLIEDFKALVLPVSRKSFACLVALFMASPCPMANFSRAISLRMDMSIILMDSSPLPCVMPGFICGFPSLPITSLPVAGSVTGPPIISLSFSYFPGSASVPLPSVPRTR